MILFQVGRKKPLKNPGGVGMRLYLKVFLYSMGFFFLFPVCSAPWADAPVAFSPAVAPESPGLSIQLDKLMKDKALKRAKVGLMVYSLDKKSVVFEKDSTRLLNPASNTKLFTSL